MLKYLDLVLSLLVALGLAALVIAFPEWRSPVRVALGLVVVLVIPGFALTSALFAREDDLDGIERLALSLGLSIAVVPLLGLVLNYTPWGIRLAPIVVTLSAFVAAMVAIAFVRRRNLPPGTAFYLPFERASFRSTAYLTVGTVVAIGGVIAVASALRPVERFTEFYLLGPGGKLEGYPSTLAPGETFVVILGIGNHEGETLSYGVSVPFDPRYERAVTTPIEHGETWQRTLELTAPEGEGRTRLAFELFRPDDPEPYRSLHLFVDLVADRGATGDGVGTGPGAEEPGAEEPGEEVPGADEPGAEELETVEPGAEEPAGVARGEGEVEPTEATSTLHRVQPGDSLFVLAQRYLGDGERYTEILALNRDLLMNADDLAVGMELRIPVVAP